MEIYMSVLNFQRIKDTMNTMANLVNHSARDMGLNARRMSTYSLLKDKAYGKYLVYYDYSW